MISKWAVAIAIILPIAGCVDSRESYWVPSDIAPLLGGGSAPAPVRPVQPVQPAQPNLPATGTAIALSEMQAKRDTRAKPEDFEEIAGVKEAHPAKNASECTKLLLWFRRNNIRLRLEVKSNSMPGNRHQKLCIFWGKDAQVQRFGYNDAYESTLTPYPESNGGYPPNPYDQDPFDTGRNPTYREDPNYHDNVRQSPQPSPGKPGEAPF